MKEAIRFGWKKIEMRKQWRPN